MLGMRRCIERDPNDAIPAAIADPCTTSGGRRPAQPARDAKLSHGRAQRRRRGARGGTMGSPTLKEFTEPVALSSTQPADRPLPRRAFELSFDLLALRARCMRDTMGGRWVGQ